MRELRTVRCSTRCGRTYYVRDDDATCPHQCHHTLCIADLEAENARLEARVDEAVKRGAKLYGWLSEAYGVAWKLAGYHAERIRERDDYKALAERRGEALEKIATLVHPARMELYGPVARADVEYFILLARDALAATPDEEKE